MKGDRTVASGSTIDEGAATLISPSGVQKTGCGTPPPRESSGDSAAPPPSGDPAQEARIALVTEVTQILGPEDAALEGPGATGKAAVYLFEGPDLFKLIVAPQDARDYR